MAGWVDGVAEKSYDYNQLSPTRAVAQFELGNNSFERIKHLSIWHAISNCIQRSQTTPE